MTHFMSQGNKNLLHVSCSSLCVAWVIYRVVLLLRISPPRSFPCRLRSAPCSRRTLTMTTSWRSSSTTSPTGAPLPTGSSGALSLTNALNVQCVYRSMKGSQTTPVSLFNILKRASAAERSWKVWPRNAYLAWHPASSCHTWANLSLRRAQVSPLGSAAEFPLQIILMNSAFKLHFMMCINCWDLITEWTHPVWMKIWSGILTPCESSLVHEATSRWVNSNWLSPISTGPQRDFLCSMQVTGGESVSLDMLLVRQGRWATAIVLRRDESAPPLLQLI